MTGSRPRAGTPSVVPATIGHLRRTPVRHGFTYRSYSWFIDIDDLPHPPRPLGPFARFDADDHFPNPPLPVRHCVIDSKATCVRRVSTHPTGR